MNYSVSLLFHPWTTMSMSHILSELHLLSAISLKRLFSELLILLATPGIHISEHICGLNLL